MLRRRLDLNGATVLITGGGSGIGAEGARQLAARGANLALVDVDEAGLASMVAEIGSMARAFPGSVTDRTRMGEITEEILAWTGRLDVVWANAGIAAEPVATIATIDEDIFERVVEIDFLGVWRTIRATLPAVRAANGHVLVTASVYAFANGVANAPYGASKAAVESLGRSLRAELAGTGTTAGVLYPGWIETPIVQESRYVDPLAKELTSIGFPGPLGKIVPVADLVAATVRGIERRAPRTIYPRLYLGWAWYRGLVNPVIDFGIDHHRKVQRLLRELEARVPGRK